MTLTNTFKKYMSNSEHSLLDKKYDDNRSQVDNQRHGNSSVFANFTLNSPKLNHSMSSLSSDGKNDPLYEVNNNMGNLNLNTKSLPNDIQRKKRYNNNTTTTTTTTNNNNTKKLSNIQIPMPTASTVLTPISTSKSLNNNNNNNNNNNTKNSLISTTPIDIFERNVQSDDNLNSSPLNFNDSIDSNNSNSLSKSNSYLLSNYRPRHLISENFTSPVLDSTVELISSKNFDNTDLVEVPHSHPSLNLFNNSNSFSGSSSPRLSLSRKYSGNNYNNNDNRLEFNHNRSKSVLSNVSSPLLNSKSENICVCNDLSPRKSISFYSYLDLVNYERMSNNNSNNNTNITTTTNNSHNTLPEPQFEIDDLNIENDSNFNCPRHGFISRRSTYQGCIDDDNAIIDDELLNDDNNNNTPTKNNSQIYKVYQNNENSLNMNDNDSCEESIQSWIPTTDTNLRVQNETKSRRQSVVEELASLKSCPTNNSYFEDELQQCATHNLIGEPIVNVCSANDYLSLRSRELRDSLVNTNNNNFASNKTILK